MKSPFVHAALISVAVVSLLAVPTRTPAQDDFEFMPPNGWALAETGEDDASSMIAEGFEGMHDLPMKNTQIEPVDGSGGFDNVAPRLGVEEGPGGLEWDPSPTYRTRYKNQTDYTITSTDPEVTKIKPALIQGNNWFTSIPHASYDGASSPYRLRFNANTYRVYTFLSGSTWVGKYANANSKLVRSGSSPNWVLTVTDTRAKTYTFNQSTDPLYPNFYRCTKIEGLGGTQITFDYSVPNQITILQKPNSGANSEVRRFVYTLTSGLLTSIAIDEKSGSSWVPYRKILFTYFSGQANYKEVKTNDLIKIEEQIRLSTPASNCSNPDDPALCPGGWFSRKWIIKYYDEFDDNNNNVGYNSVSNPGKFYQAKAIFGPESVRQYENANGSDQGLFTTRASNAALGNYLDTFFKYNSDRTLRDLSLKSGCGCGGGEGDYSYEWQFNGTPTDLNTWSTYVKITISSKNSARILDYNSYGQAINIIDQTQDASRRWMRKRIYLTYGNTQYSYSPAACDTYTNHVINLKNPTAGQAFQYTYDGNRNLSIAKLLVPQTTNWRFQRKLTFAPFPATGNRFRWLKTADSVYAIETNIDNQAITTTFGYTFHPGDSAAILKRTTTLPLIPTSQNGPGDVIPNDRFVRKDLFEIDGFHTWSRDPEKSTPPAPAYEEIGVHYTGYHQGRWVVTKTITNANTSLAEVPDPPDTQFVTSTGANLVTETQHDENRRPILQYSPLFYDDGGTGLHVTTQWFFTRLADGTLVTIHYPCFSTLDPPGPPNNLPMYFHTPIAASNTDLEGHVLSSANFGLGVAFRNNTLNDDFSTNAISFADGFTGKGTFLQRTDDFYTGDKLTTEKRWIVATGADADSNKYITINTYDVAGRKTETKNAVGTITRWTLDVLDRGKQTEIGTNSGAPGDMTIVEKQFYDGEEGNPNAVGDGFLTRVERYTDDSSNNRATVTAYDYRGRVTSVTEPLGIYTTTTYDNRNLPLVTSRYTSQGGTLLWQTENLYDNWGQVYKSIVYGVTTAGTINGQMDTNFTRNARGMVVRTRSRSQVLTKAFYDGAGRVILQATSYDPNETSYADAYTLNSDKVIEQAKQIYDGLGSVRLRKSYSRNHDNTTYTGDLSASVPLTASSRPQFGAYWFDTLHRLTHIVNRGTNGGADYNPLPTDPPPSSISTANELVRKFSYTYKDENGAGLPPYTKQEILSHRVDGQDVTERSEYDDWGRLAAFTIDNYGLSGPANDHRIEYEYNGSNQAVILRTKAQGIGEIDQTTQSVFGITKGSQPGDSKIASNDLLKQVNYPDPTTGLPSSSAVDQMFFAYNGQGETIWRKDQVGTVHEYSYDDRGRMTHDRVTTFGSINIEDTVKRISKTYDSLDRPVNIRSHDNTLTDTSGILNDVQIQYGRYSLIDTVYQEWAGTVNVNTSPRVVQSYTDLNGIWAGSNGGLRRTSVTYPTSSYVVTDLYTSEQDNMLSRISGKQRTSVLYQDYYSGSNTLVRRVYQTAPNLIEMTLVGTDPSNNDNYVGLDRFSRVDDFRVLKNSTYEINHFSYSYNYWSQVTLRDVVEPVPADQSQAVNFDETFSYNNLGKLIEHQRGHLVGASMNPLLLKECFTVDYEANILSYSNSALQTCPTSWTATYNSSNEFLTWTQGSIVYDLAGNIRQKGTSLELVYDAWNRLVQVYGAYSITYVYNGLSQLIGRIGASVPDAQFYYSVEGQVLEERAYGTSTVLQNYIWGTNYIDDIVLRNISTPQYLITDRNYNVITRYDTAFNAVTARYVFDAYGKPWALTPDWSTFQSITENLYLFTSRDYLLDHGQYNFRSRIYDPELSRFVQRDPIGIWGDPNASGNGYLFVSADPSNNLDPLGLASNPRAAALQYWLDHRCSGYYERFGNRICVPSPDFTAQIYASIARGETLVPHPGDLTWELVWAWLNARSPEQLIALQRFLVLAWEARIGETSSSSSYRAPSFCGVFVYRNIDTWDGHEWVEWPERKSAGFYGIGPGTGILHGVVRRPDLYGPGGAWYGSRPKCEKSVERYSQHSGVVYPGGPYTLPLYMKYGIGAGKKCSNVTCSEVYSCLQSYNAWFYDSAFANCRSYVCGAEGACCFRRIGSCRNIAADPDRPPPSGPLPPLPPGN